MNIEIERKFLVNQIPINREKTIHIKQYYLSISDKIVQRLRIFDHVKAILSFKENCSGLTRHEFEYEIPLKDANKLIDISQPISIEKKRHIVVYNNLKWEIDEFLDNNKGLIIAEIELNDEKEKINLPDWIKDEVTNKNKYYNYNLALNPYISWRD